MIFHSGEVLPIIIIEIYINLLFNIDFNFYNLTFIIELLDEILIITNFISCALIIMKFE